MGTKEQLLRLLEDNRERHVSGAAMAKAIGVSRNAVWKAVEALRAEGYAIDAVTNRGYALSQENDLLSPQGIERFLPDNRAFAVTVRKRVDSTNAEARRRALEGAAEGTVVVAEEQIAGKGRPGKTFFSPAPPACTSASCCAPRWPPTAANSSHAPQPWRARRLSSR